MNFFGLLSRLRNRFRAGPDSDDELVRVEAELKEVREELQKQIEERNAALKRSLEFGGRERDRVRQREQGFRSAVEASPAAVIVTDSKGRILLVNGETERCFGYGRGELVGDQVEKLVPSDLRSSHRARVVAYFRDPKPMRLGVDRDMRGQRCDGSQFPIEVGLSPIHSNEGVQVLVSILDVTERKRTETTLRRQTRELERSNRELEQFASVVSHDLKSPLRGISSLAEWIVADYGDVLDDAGREQLELLRERTVRIHRMIEGILEYSRAGRGTEHRSRIAASEVVRGVIDVLAPPPNVSIHVEEPLPNCYCNEIQLAQVFQNLIANAIQHLGKPSGSITISGRQRDDRVEFRVADTGVGIPTEHHERIFRIFQTLDPKQRKGRSTGIGLSIVKKIVEFNGGELAIESQSGEGSVFYFTMPTER